MVAEWSSSSGLNNLVMKTNNDFLIDLPHETQCIHIVVPKTTVFPKTRKHEHILMPVFMSWEPPGKIINVKAFSYSGKDEIRGDICKCCRSGPSRGDSVKCGHWDNGLTKKRTRVVSSSYRLLRRLEMKPFNVHQLRTKKHTQLALYIRHAALRAQKNL